VKRLLVPASKLGAAVFLGAAYAQSALAANSEITSGSQAAHATDTPTSLTGSVKTISNVLIFVIGAIAVIMLIIGGFRYVVSQGDPASTKAAKDTILYAIVGLIVAILAYAIVNYVTTAFK
jgi:multisubunit Na+/H+ antiporter MnhB subunit